ncbi:unnamed protein product [Adineta ricciae]|uniref:Uncharacterized protein n=1 Tax=Adineta ricciae TaxID=249248 RepID=A0A815T814_ADIRI|nr:unnamed protein product [Adineta ricciae]
MKSARRFAAMISTVNDYSLLKWPLTITSILITVVALVLLLGFQSNHWFRFEEIMVNSTLHTAQNTAFYHVKPYIHGSFGLWKFCSNTHTSLTITCDTYTRASRPEYFSLILILVSCVLFLVNLAIFPSWASTILVLYNANNAYVAYIVVFIWTTFLFSLVISVLLVCVMMFVGASSFYAPGHITSSDRKTIYHGDSGLFLVFCSTILSLICLLALIITLIWKKFIDVKLYEAEKELYRQLADDNFQPGWNKIIRIQRTDRNSDEDDNNSYSPPPYQDNARTTNQ